MPSLRNPLKSSRLRQHKLKRHAAREISYASSARTKGGRAVIRMVENATGRLRLIRRADGYEDEVARGRDFWEVMVERYGLSLDIVAGQLENIPTTGPLILSSNHPYGILDGMMMGYMKLSSWDLFAFHLQMTDLLLLKHVCFWYCGGTNN